MLFNEDSLEWTQTRPYDQLLWTSDNLGHSCPDNQYSHEPMKSCSLETCSWNYVSNPKVLIYHQSRPLELPQFS